jgi:hypothetical protein
MALSFCETVCQPNPCLFHQHSLPWMREGAVLELELLGQKAMLDLVGLGVRWEEYVTVRGGRGAEAGRALWTWWLCVCNRGGSAAGRIMG